MEVHHTFTFRSNGGLLRSIISPVLAAQPDNTLLIDGFRGLWDTGATHTVITQEVVDKLGLLPVGMTHVNTASESNVLTAQYILDIYLKKDLRVKDVLVTLGKLAGNIHFLIGMDIINLGDLSLTNHNKVTCMSFRIPSSHEIDFVKNPLFGIKELDGRNVSKNQKCPCGSGKLYKRCHGQDL